MCDGDHDAIYHQITSGRIETSNSMLDHECKMIFTARSSVKVEVITEQIYMSSMDCDEEYFGIFGQSSLPITRNSKLCYDSHPGDRLDRIIRRVDNSQYNITFKLRLDWESDLPAGNHSFISLLFNSESYMSDYLVIQTNDI